MIYTFDVFQFDGIFGFGTLLPTALFDYASLR